MNRNRFYPAIAVLVVLAGGAFVLTRPGGDPAPPAPPPEGAAFLPMSDADSRPGPPAPGGRPAPTSEDPPAAAAEASGSESPEDRSPPPTARAGAGDGVDPAADRIPSISITSEVPEYQAAETRLALFIKALQTGKRERAAELLSRRVPTEAREALLRGDWLAPEPQGENDFSQVLYHPDLQVGIQHIFSDSVTLFVTPRKRSGPENEVRAYLEVRMRREDDGWWVEMQPKEL
jgi:hypothetical protein